MAHTTARKALGAFGEQAASEMLTASGMAVLDRNWTSRYGEIDIVARDGATLVVVEVKTRRSVRFGAPHEAVVPAKLARLRRLTGVWIDAHREALGWVRGVRIDVVAVRLLEGRPPTVEHLRGVS
ncbi:MAG: YraN family protein [Dermatophilus congolensis]|nr:YraN family protein [Dermatophilus congolensis]